MASSHNKKNSLSRNRYPDVLFSDAEPVNAELKKESQTNSASPPAEQINVEPNTSSTSDRGFVRAPTCG